MITDINQLDFSKQYTYADYLTWKFKERVELIRGWIMKMAAPSIKHQQFSRRLQRQMDRYFGEGPCQFLSAPVDVRLPDYRYPANVGDDQIYDTVQPDLLVVCDPAKLDAKGCLGAPDWIIEILSPGNSKKEMQHKHALYEWAGVREYWIVQPEHLTTLVFDLVDGAYRMRKAYAHDDDVPCGVFPELSIDMRLVFPDDQKEWNDVVAEEEAAYRATYRSTPQAF